MRLDRGIRIGREPRLLPSGACRRPGAGAEQPDPVKPGADAGLKAAVAVKTAHSGPRPNRGLPAAIPDR
jgi:hypothetical protein